MNPFFSAKALLLPLLFLCLLLPSSFSWYTAGKDSAVYASEDAASSAVYMYRGNGAGKTYHPVLTPFSVYSQSELYSCDCGIGSFPPAYRPSFRHAARFAKYSTGTFF